ncbi:MAG: TVP38/TMEM64 family protein [Desulfobacterales bacterium]|jgi:uncharacterized membrane protein YdjX (TVP38/TMEM64 family)
MIPSRYQPSRTVAIVIVVLLGGLLIAIFHEAIWHGLTQAYRFLIDRDRTEAFIRDFGPRAPLVFMAVQLLQVILAPIPGEATGFIGGYLFGATQGFVYSSISLAIGSIINFMIGRFLGRRFVRRLIPARKLQRMDQTVTHHGALVIFLLFVFPGFPKDYLCLFLGVTTMPFKLFFLMATFGRMPGTLMLSLQGAMLFERMYGVFAVVLAICGLGILLAYRYRQDLYRWIEKMEAPQKPRR